MNQFNYENTCRICLKPQGIFFSLFRKSKGFSPYEKLISRTKLKLDFNDNCPASICSECFIELENTVNFLEKCERSNLILANQVPLTSDAEISECTFFKNEVVNFEVDISSKAIDEVNVVEIKNNVEKVKKFNEKAYGCSECGSRRRCKHWKPPLVHQCQYCNKVFTRRFNFDLHVKRHLGERDWSCPKCGAKQLTRWHAEQHCSIKPRRICPVPGCEKSFTTNTNLNTHIRSHNGERPFGCNYCGKAFTSKNTLRDHIRIHTGVKPYVCPICGKQFTTNKLTSHVRSHGASRPRPRPARPAPYPAPAPCALCGAVYRHEQSLRKHVRKNHPQNPTCVVQTDQRNITNQIGCT